MSSGTFFTFSLLQDIQK